MIARLTSGIIPERPFGAEYRYHDDYQVAGFYRAVLEKTGALPGVRSAVAVTASR